ncbi:MAG: 1-acyl-sn-glycerol-3-phosphate acyltransferase [Rhodobacteraceae bacterium]|nr:1-acyl-sn-glycerol-3-phosphate acyltransferase [Paracoccaceae bacterium]
MFQPVQLPLWLLILILAFAAVTFASHFFFPSVRWFLRRRAERVVAELNKRLERPIQPFKLARRTDMIQRVIYDRDVVAAVQARATETGRREDVVFEEARRYAREIVPSFSATAYFGFSTRAAKRLTRFLFDVHFAEARHGSLAGIPAEATVIYVMNHRSNMDYVLVTYLAASRSALSYAVGEWARVWPLTGFIRWMGAFFIRRRSSNTLYRRVLARYVQLSTQAGVPQAMFPEGGLSLSGAPGEPKLGLISYIIEGYTDEGRDMVFVPVAINYDRVLEDRVLVAAERRGDRRFRASLVEASLFVTRYLWRRVRGRGHRFGVAAVVVAEPLSLREMTGDGLPPAPADLAAGADDDVVAAVAARLPFLEGQGLFLAFDPAHLDAAVRHELEVFRRRKILGPGPGIVVQADGPELLAFYAQSIAHHFAPGGYHPEIEARPAEFEPT